MSENNENYTQNKENIIQLPLKLYQELRNELLHHEKAEVDRVMGRDQEVAAIYEGQPTSRFLEISYTESGKEKIYYDHVGQGKEIAAMIKYRHNQFGQFYYNENTGLWNSNPKAIIKEILTKKLGKYYSANREKETMCLIEAFFYDNSVTDLPFDKDPYIIGFKNGVYDMRTDVFCSYKPEHYLTMKIPHDFNPAANNKITERYLDDLLGERKLFFYEWIGYSLFKDYPFQCFLVLHGNGRNGKSLLLEWYKHVIGLKNVSHVSLRELQESKFAQSSLIGKMANVFADIGDDYFKFSDIIKTLTGNDSITVDRKNQAYVTFKNYAKLSFSANKLPKFKDRSEGLSRRIILLPMFKQVKKTKVNILERLLAPEEVEGTIVKAIAAFKGVLERKEFSITADMNEGKERWLEEMNNVKMFVNECCEIKTDAKVKLEWLYPKYVDYCIKNEYKHLRERDFKQELLRSYPEVSYDQRGKNDRQRYFWNLYYPM